MFDLMIRTLKEHDDAYYNGDVEITDADYDDLKDKARAIRPDHPYFDDIGAPISGKKVDLPFVLGSLHKKKTDTIEKWIEKHPGPHCISEKLDGVSFMVTYGFKDGKVISATTRGDGYQGSDITDKAKMFCPVIKNLKHNFSFRCEAMLIGDTHKKLGFKTRRNGTAGILNKDGIKNAKYIVPYFYEILDGGSVEHDSEISKFTLMQSMGLKTPNIMHMSNSPDVIESLTDFLTMCKSHLKDIDGLVITPDNYVREDVLYPENKIAFKVNEKGVKTEVIDVEWNTSRTGRIIPTVIVKTIIINGVSIQRATGHNAKYIQENKICKGSMIDIQRSGDVIPFISKVYK